MGSVLLTMLGLPRFLGCFEISHDVASFAFGKVEELKADARESDRLNKKLYTMMARNCGKPDDYFLKFTAMDSVGNGRADLMRKMK